MATLHALNRPDAPPMHFYIGPVTGKVFGRRNAHKILGEALCTYSTGRHRRFLLAVMTTDPNEVTCKECRAKLVELGKLEG